VKRDKETERERESTLIPGFFVDISTRAHFLKQSHKQSHKLSHPNTQDECVCVCVRARPCVLVLLRRKRAAAERVNLWAGYLDQTSARRFGKHQSKWLCSAVGSPATASRSKSGLTSPPRQSQYLWIKHDASRMRLQERSRTCEAEDARAFAVQRANFPVSPDTSIPGKPHLKP
jgi:hypothetical protein